MDELKDLIVIVGLLTSFATLLTCHMLIALRLLRRKEERSRGLLVLLLPPLAPFWAHQHGWRGLGRVWLAAVVVYALVRVLAEL